MIRFMVRPFCSAVALSAVFAVVGTSIASAQNAPAEAAPPPVGCQRPADDPPAKPTKAEMAKFQKLVDDYKACTNAYAQDTMTKAKELQAQALDIQAQAQSRQALAQAYANAANGAIGDFNTYAASLNKQREDAPKK